MGKRKRSEDSLDEKLERYKTDLFRALKKVKGFERQRLSRRIHEKGIPQDKKEKFELEVAVLKSLDLHQTSYHYLYTSLLKIKSVANHPDLPPIVRRAIPKPDLEEREQAALHHVTSCLFNRLEVKAVMEKVVGDVCGALGLPPPEKKGGKKKGAKEDGESGPRAAVGDRKKGAVDGAAADNVAKKERKEKTEKTRDDGEKAKKTKTLRKQDSETEDEDDDAPGEEMDTDAEERAFAKYESLLARSDDSDADSESESDRIQKGKRRSIRVRDMSISLSPEPESASSSPFASADGLDAQSESEAQPESDSESESEPDEPPLKQPKLSKKSRARSPDQAFLPSLMGGYVSGSESASDVDVAPRKNRLGQKQRQAIWERKFGAQAKHVQQEQKQKGRRKGGARDDGWDLRRGAVDEEARGRKPWKKGVEGPLAAMKGAGPGGAGGERKPTKKDDEGPLHPSWEARKRAKEKEQQQPRRIEMRPTGGNKIVFDD